jgi:tetratricopeptide (TPR) repeat protein
MFDAEETSDLNLVVASWWIGSMEPDFGPALDLVRVLGDRTDNETLRAFAHLYAAHLELGLGRPSAARNELARIAELDPDLAFEYDALWALPEFMPVPEARLDELRDSVNTWMPAVAPAVASPPSNVLPTFLALTLEVRPHIRQYLLGRLSARLGDYDLALQHAGLLEEMEAPEEAGSLAVDLAQSIRAHVSWYRGRPADALAALEAAPRAVRFSRRWFPPFYTEPQERFLRAEALAELGRYDDALRWFDSIGRRPAGAPLVAPSYLRKAEIYERLGDSENAELYYNRFIELWQDCDPELRPMVEAAEQALERLTAEPGTD